jgi:hypothetical protein
MYRCIQWKKECINLILNSTAKLPHSRRRRTTTINKEVEEDSLHTRPGVLRRLLAGREGRSENRRRKKKMKKKKKNKKEQNSLTLSLSRSVSKTGGL